jgi:hypothetical protein
MGYASLKLDALLCPISFELQYPSIRDPIVVFVDTTPDYRSVTESVAAEPSPLSWRLSVLIDRLPGLCVTVKDPNISPEIACSVVPTCG